MATRTVMVKLEMEGGSEDCGDAVDWVLDNGDFQDAINEYAKDTGRDARVVSAMVTEVGG